MPSSYKHNFKDPNLNNLHTAMTYTDVDTPTVRVEVTKIPEVEVKNDQGVPLKVDVVTIPEVEVKNDSGNPLRVNVITIPEVEIKNVDNSVSTWVASINDQLAVDWYVVKFY